MAYAPVHRDEEAEHMDLNDDDDIDEEYYDQFKSNIRQYNLCNRDIKTFFWRLP